MRPIRCFYPSPSWSLFGGSSFLSMPVAEGDNCIVLFNDRELDQWYSGTSQVPQTPRVHDLSDGIAIVGINPLTKSIATYLANGIRLSHGGSSGMDLTDAAINTMALLFTHTGNMKITGDLELDGNLSVTGETHGISGGTLQVDSNFIQTPGKTMAAGNGV